MIFGSRRQLSLTVKPQDVSQLDQAMDDATLALRIARRLKPKQPDNFGLFTSDTILSLYHQATNGIFAVLVGVVALSLVVGGIVIMNIMLMVVTERTREIGLRKALGARRADIMAQMLTESVVLSMFGGVIGVMLGAAFATVVSQFTPIPASVELWSVALGIGITALVGLFFGLYPACARRAPRSDRSAAQGVTNVRSSLLSRSRRHGVRHRAQQQDALGADGARRGHRHHVDRRHDRDDPRLRPVAARHDPLDRPEHHLRPALRPDELDERRHLQPADEAAEPDDLRRARARRGRGDD